MTSQNGGEKNISDTVNGIKFFFKSYYQSQNPTPNFFLRYNTISKPFRRCLFLRLKNFTVLGEKPSQKTITKKSVLIDHGKIGGNIDGKKIKPFRKHCNEFFDIFCASSLGFKGSAERTSNKNFVRPHVLRPLYSVQCTVLHSSSE